MSAPTVRRTVSTWSPCRTSSIWSRTARLRRDATLVAAAGNDRALVVLDVRAPDTTAPVLIDNAHDTAINCVQWSPSNDFLLLSSSFSPALFVHDLRKPDEPVACLRGHVSSRVARSKVIQHPTFVDNGRRVATGGEGSRALSLFCTNSSRMLSQLAFGSDLSGVVSADSVADCAAQAAVDSLALTLADSVDGRAQLVAAFGGRRATVTRATLSEIETSDA